ncbi:MAG: response regulator, partial [Rhodospirillales bacterium]|nr:response regulator [Rhodospirillales bacterium]
RQHYDDLENHRPFRDFNFDIPTSDGNAIPASVNGTPVFDQDGTFRGYRGTGKDNSKIILLEQQFRRSQKMEAVGQLTGGIAHDFNNILGIVMGNLQILQRMVGKDAKATDRIDVALKGVMRGADLTRKLLGFSRMEAHGTKLTSVNEFIENLEELLSKSLTVAIKVEHHLSADLWKVEVDPGDLQDTILNLALNARDAMPDGGRLVIETANKVLDEKYVRHNPQYQVGEFVMLSVSDTGHGMTPEIRERVLEPFFSTKEEGKGTGLGLSMVYGFVQRSGGHISIYSERGEGTTVNLYLPRGNEDVNREKKSEADLDLPHGKEIILVVDDEEHLVEIAVSHLHDLGYRTITANSGDQAIKIIEDNQDIDLLFSDIIMPGDLDGYQLAIAAQKKCPSLKALLTSGFTKKKEDYFSPDGSKYAELAANLLNKPYNQTELAKAVRNTLDGVDDFSDVHDRNNFRQT